MELTAKSALVSIGGRATRLRLSSSTLPPGDSKSFLTIAGRPALFWTLSNLRRAGVKEVVLAAENELLLQRGAAIAHQVGFQQEEIKTYRDDGLGVHGLPFHAAHLLGSRFIFEAGHGMAPAFHYRRLLATQRDRVVYSTFPASSRNRSRTRIRIERGDRAQAERVVALPYCVDIGWSDRIAHESFSIARAIKADAEHDRAVFIDGHFEPEFDYLWEYQKVRRRGVVLTLARTAWKVMHGTR